MKTIFITIFEGVESKNILRTDILPTLLNDPKTRIVLFTKSRERVEYHQREFRNPRICYEVVEVPLVSGLDKFFQRLKFLLLSTGTTALRREMVFDRNKNRLSYYAGIAANWCLARPAVRRAVRWFDLKLVKGGTYRKFFEKYRPDLLICANLFDEPEVHFLREAKRCGVKNIGFINSWDKATARCILRLLPDKAVVFNNLLKREMIDYHDIREEDIFVGGIPQYDQYFSFRPKPRREFLRFLGLDPIKKIIVYSPVGGMFGDSDWTMIDILYRLKNSGKFGSEAELFLRFPPNDFIDAEELARRPFLKYAYPGARFSKKRGIDWDMNFTELEHLSNTLCHMSLLVGYASSIGVDAAVFDKPVICINYEVRKEQMIKSPSVYSRMSHYQKALSSGGIRLVNNEEELVEWVLKYLENPALDSKARRRLFESQCQFLDGKSGERIGKFILSQIPLTYVVEK